MLVLSRKVNERIVIGFNVQVTVLAVRGNRVKLGIVAPNDVPIHRRELYNRIVQAAVAPCYGETQQASREQP
jgi:carbon storage regulator